MIMPLKGKIINAFSCSKEKFFSNDEVQSINRIILGSDYRKNFDVSECKVDKVIFLCDSDHDGYHICSLLERMFLLYYPQMIQAGMVYKAMPPLFSVKTGGKQRCFVDNYEMIKFNQKVFSQKYQLLNSKKVPLTPKELTLFFAKNADYNFYLDDNNMYPVEKPLFEDIVTCYVECGEKVNFDKLTKLIKSKYRFINVIKDKSGLVTIKGTITKANIVPLTDKFFSDCKDIIKIIKSNDCLHYYIGNQPMTINQVMTLYEKTQPSGVHRYKGLGETSEEILEKSVMSPLADRVLVQYTLEDIKEAVSTVREYESDKKKILSLVGNVTREDLIE